MQTVAATCPRVFCKRTPSNPPTHLERSQKRFKLRDVLRLHRKNVCADAQDTVQEEDARRVGREVNGAVVVAEMEVVHEAAVGVLLREAAVLLQEVDNRPVGVDVLLQLGLDEDILRRDRLRGLARKKGLLAQARIQHQAAERALDGLEDRAVEVKVPDAPQGHVFCREFARSPARYQSLSRQIVAALPRHVDLARSRLRKLGLALPLAHRHVPRHEAQGETANADDKVHHAGSSTELPAYRAYNTA